jgi:hypothetical protein
MGANVAEESATSVSGVNNKKEVHTEFVFVA